MSDQWEIASSLNQKNPADRNVKAEDGYTNLERYLNALTP